jgi:hypothetical protein
VYATYATHGYFFCDSLVDHATAKQNCASVGMSLAHINDADENQFIDTEFNANNCCPQSLAVNPMLYGLWIGGSDEQTENTWVWEDDQSPFWMGRYSYVTLENGSAVNGSFASWGVHQPDSGYDKEEDCLRTTGLLWNDTPCQTDPLQDLLGLGYICKGPAAP